MSTKTLCVSLCTEWKQVPCQTAWRLCWRQPAAGTFKDLPGPSRTFMGDRSSYGQEFISLLGLQSSRHFASFHPSSALVTHSQFFFFVDPNRKQFLLPVWLRLLTSCSSSLTFAMCTVYLVSDFTHSTQTTRRVRKERITHTGGRAAAASSLPSCTLLPVN